MNRSIRIAAAGVACVAVAACRVAEGSTVTRMSSLAADTAPGREARSVYRTWHDAECPFGWETANTRFVVVGSSVVDEPRHMVLEETTETRACDNDEGRELKLTVAARPAARPDARPLWTLSTPGDQGEVWFDYGYALYRVRLFGCCDQENTDHFFNLADGRLRFSSSAEQPLRIEGPGRNGAYVAFHGGNASEPPREIRTDETVAGVFHFAPDGDGPVQRAVLRAGRDPYRVVGFLLMQGDSAASVDGKVAHFPESGSASMPIRAVLTLERITGEATEPERVEIPVENGRLAIEKARLPAGMRLAAAPAER